MQAEPAVVNNYDHYLQRHQIVKQTRCRLGTQGSAGQTSSNRRNGVSSAFSSTKLSDSKGFEGRNGFGSIRIDAGVEGYSNTLKTDPHKPGRHQKFPQQSAYYSGNKPAGVNGS